MCKCCINNPKNMHVIIIIKIGKYFKRNITVFNGEIFVGLVFSCN